ITLFWGMACTSLACAAYIMIPIVFKPEYIEATLPLWILLSASVASIPAVAGYSALANSTSTTYVPMIAAIFSAATNIGANFILIPKYGMAGCAAATLLSYFVSSAVFGLLLKKTVKMPISWSFVAIVPSVVGTILFYLYQNAGISVAAAVATTLIVGFLFRESLMTALLFLKDLRTARPQQGE
ncbi:MAG TPA: polysaccharide biosynthesis C-terminal domain-containing protein, partial [Pyrinomonadaceae bacterium]|nr:polysaccharide biosynthesis C-terminal domain-containing protein [Pyrinomonadaceae bacterium]